jgi:hypothetical protein
MANLAHWNSLLGWENCTAKSVQGEGWDNADSLALFALGKHDPWLHLFRVFY